MKRILITASRVWASYKLMRRAIVAHGPAIVVHGDCRGGDKMAARIARSLGWPAEPHPADWSRGLGAGFDRNQDMVDLGADVCLAFPMPGSRGTWDCVRRARLAGIQVVVVEDTINRNGQV